MAAVLLGLVAAVVLMSKFTILVEDPFSFAVAVIAVTVVGAIAIACAEACAFA